jgi:hypothetical protein
MNLATFSSFRRRPESSGFLGSGFRRNDGVLMHLQIDAGGSR